MVYWCQGHLIAGYQGTGKQLNLSWRTSQKGYPVTWRDLLVDACRLLEQFSHWNTDLFFYLCVRVYIGLFCDRIASLATKTQMKGFGWEKDKSRKSTEKKLTRLIWVDVLSCFHPCKQESPACHSLLNIITWAAEISLHTFGKAAAERSLRKESWLRLIPSQVVNQQTTWD